MLAHAKCGRDNSAVSSRPPNDGIRAAPRGIFRGVRRDPLQISLSCVLERYLL